MSHSAVVYMLLEVVLSILNASKESSGSLHMISDDRTRILDTIAKIRALLY